MRRRNGVVLPDLYGSVGQKVPREPRHLGCDSQLLQPVEVRRLRGFAIRRSGGARVFPVGHRDRGAVSLFMAPSGAENIRENFWAGRLSPEMMSRSAASA